MLTFIDGASRTGALVARYSVERKSSAIPFANLPITFAVQDLFETDFSSATVVALYLFPELNARLRPKLLADLRPGARVVSHQFGIAGWPPQDGARIPVGDTIHDVFLWVVPRA